MLNRLPLLGFVSRVAAASALLAMPAVAQAPHPLTSADRQRIDEIVHKMTLAEKLDYIGGMEMTIRAVPSVNVRALQMSDGPVGVRLDYRVSLDHVCGRDCSGGELGPRTCATRGRRHWTRCARAGHQLHAGPGSEHLSFAAQRPQLRILRRRSVSGCEHGRRIHHRHAGAGRQLDDQALPGQQLGVPAARFRFDHRCADDA